MARENLNIFLASSGLDVFQVFGKFIFPESSCSFCLIKLRNAI